MIVVFWADVLEDIIPWEQYCYGIIYLHECLAGVPVMCSTRRYTTTTRSWSPVGWLGWPRSTTSSPVFGNGTFPCMSFASSAFGNASSFPSRLLTTATLRPDIVALNPWVLACWRPKRLSSIIHCACAGVFVQSSSLSVPPREKLPSFFSENTWYDNVMGHGCVCGGWWGGGGWGWGGTPSVRVRPSFFTSGTPSGWVLNWNVKHTPVGYDLFILSHSLWVIFVKFSYLATLLGHFCENPVGVKIHPADTPVGVKIQSADPSPLPVSGRSATRALGSTDWASVGPTSDQCWLNSAPGDEFLFGIIYQICTEYGMGVYIFQNDVFCWE